MHADEFTEAAYAGIDVCSTGPCGPAREEFVEIMEDLGFTREAADGGDGDSTGCYGVDTLYRHAAEAVTHNDAVMAMFRLVASEQVAPNMPPEAEALFEHFLAQDHWMTRRATVQAITYPGWPESLRILKRVASEDPDERVREFAARQIEPVRRHLARDHDPGRQ